jgi:hypothetical protein
LRHHLPVALGKVRPSGSLRQIAIGTMCLLLAGGCAAGDPGTSGTARPVSTGTGATDAPTPPATEPGMSIGVVESADPAAVLTGRAVEALGENGVDVVLRIGAEGFQLPDGERLYDVHGDRVLAARSGTGSSETVLVVRDLDGALLREIATGMQLPQTGIVRGDDVYFGGIDLGEDGSNLDLAVDRGVWIARGDAPPAPVLAAEESLAVYTAIERSPDGRTVGVWRCGEICATILVGPDGRSVEVPEPGLIALTNEVALLISEFSNVTAYAVDDGAELWGARSAGVYYGRYATADGDRIVLSAVEADPDGGSTDQLRIELLDALTGVVERTVLVSSEASLPWVAPTLSNDRYVALLDTVLPDTERAPHRVRFVDLAAERLLDTELFLGDAP